MVPHLSDTRLRQVTWPDFVKHHEYIVEMLRAGVSKATIHQRLRDEHGVTGSLASFKRYVTANLADPSKQRSRPPSPQPAPRVAAGKR